MTTVLITAVVGFIVAYLFTTFVEFICKITKR